MKFYSPTIEEIESARESFEENEPRDLFYRAATELVDLAIRKETTLTVVEAIAILLRTWNQMFYRFHQAFNNEHLREIERLIISYDQIIRDFRQRTIESLSEKDKITVAELFREFEIVLGPVGAAKSLHLLAPQFFPLWDNKIARNYNVPLIGRGFNSSRYLRFMRITKQQSLSLGGEQNIGRNPLKALDEFNYCRYTQNWI